MKGTRFRQAVGVIGRSFDWGVSLGVATGLACAWRIYTENSYPQQKLFQLWVDRSVSGFFGALAIGLSAAVGVGILLAAARLVTGSRVRSWATLVGTAGFTGLALAFVFNNFRERFSDFFPDAYDTPPLTVGTVLRNFILPEGLEALHSPSRALSVLGFWVVLLAIGFALGLAAQAVIFLPFRARLREYEGREKKPSSDRVVKWQVIRRVATVFTLIFALAVAGLNALVPGLKSHPVIWISLDTLRADHLPAYGYARDTSPRLSELAEEAVVFDRAIAPSPWTLPTHMSWLTGEYPSAHGVVDMNRGLSSRALTLTEVLANAGYDTAAVVSSYMMSPRYGFDQGFAAYRFRPKALAPEVTETALELLDGMGAESFFLFVHYFDIHHPFEPPVEDVLPFAGEEAVRKYMGRTWAHYHDWVVDAMAMDDEAFQYQLDAYDGEIRFTDRHVGMLVDALKAKGVWDEALVIVTSDHGEEWKEHGFVGHSLTLFDEVARVPLLVKPPKSAAISPRRVAQVVSTLDIARTTAAFVGVELPGDRASRDLRPLLSGVDKDWTPLAFCETELWGPRRIAAVWGGWKRAEAYSYRFGDFDGAWPEQLFAVPVDPDEKTNLAQSPFHEPFRWFLEGETLRLKITTGTADKDVSGLEMEPETRERLRALGYVQ